MNINLKQNNGRYKALLTGPGSRSEVLKIAMPLILSTSAMTIQMFIDRVFLMWYGSEAMSGAMYGGLVSFTILSFFLGTVTYVNTFIAQYDGAGMPKRIGASIWQGIYFAVAAGLLIAAFSFLAETVMNLAGHDSVVRGHEVVYFKILCLGSMPYIMASALSCFFTGRGKTWTIMWVSFIATAFNLIFDYLLIFGKYGLPRWGVAGAALATVSANVLSMLIYFALIFSKRNRKNYAIENGWRFDIELFRRLMRFGLPSGIQFMLDVLGFSFFVTFIGRIGPVCLAATSIAAQINRLAFMPMFGFNTAICTLVGRYLGKNRADLAQRSTWSAFAITAMYMTLIALCFILFPDFFLYPFASQADVGEYVIIRPIVINLLYFIAFYCLLDAGNLIFSGALKGAGDTRFVMKVSVSLNWLIMVIPSYFAIKFVRGTAGLYLAWAALTVYVCVLAIIFLIRFLAGKWKTMRVIEAAVQIIPQNIPAIPTVEAELPVFTPEETD